MQKKIDRSIIKKIDPSVANDMEEDKIDKSINQLNLLTGKYYTNFKIQTLRILKFNY